MNAPMHSLNDSDLKPWETQLALEDISSEEVVAMLSVEAYFDRMKIPMPEYRREVLKDLESNHLIKAQGEGRFAITNLGALCLAKKLSRFPSLTSKAVRLIRYRSMDRSRTDQEICWDHGYAVDHEGLIRIIRALLPSREVIEGAYRRQEHAYSESAVRELLVNALVRQDFEVGDNGPVVEIFPDRMEVSYPRRTSDETAGPLDSPACSRNEVLAEMLRRLGLFRASGWGANRVATLTKAPTYPAPRFEVDEDVVRAVLFGRRLLG